MTFFQEYSLLIAVSTPVAVLLAMNVALWLFGERSTLVMPGLMSFSPVELAVRDVTPAAEGTPSALAANDEARAAA